MYIDCKKCVFYDTRGYKDMGYTCPICKLKAELEHKKHLWTYGALIQCEIKDCLYYTDLSKLVNKVVNKVKFRKDI